MIDTSSLTAQTIGLEKFSPSILGTYEDCPRLFYYQNWLGLKLDEDRLHLDFGNAIHEAINQVYLEYDDNFGGAWSAGDFEKVKERFLMYWKQSNVPEETFTKFMSTAAGSESGFTKKEDLYEDFKEDGLIMLKAYWDKKEILLVEYGHDLVDFELYKKQILFNPLNDTEKLPIPASYRIDARNRDNTKTVDFKTSKSKYNLEETRKKIQGQLYLLGQWCETGKFCGEFDYTVLRKGLKTDDRIEVVRLVYDEADLVACFYRIQAILAKIANREFDRPSRGHANYCQCIKFEEALRIET